MPKELMHRLGHASPAAALIYQHAVSERDSEIARALDAKVTGEVASLPEQLRGSEHKGLSSCGGPLWSREGPYRPLTRGYILKVANFPN